ncbi:MAG: YggT family protein [Treponema sp.]|nr:YggT family protein [Treponema sp.]
MIRVVSFVSSVVSIYMMIVFARIMLSWFSWMRGGTLQVFLSRVTDPYLNWFRRFPLRVGFLDLSPVVALAVLSLVNGILSTIAVHQSFSIGILLALVLQMAWGAVSFLLLFLIIVFALRLVATLARLNAYNPLWRIVDAIFQPVSYKINRIFFKNRIFNFTSSTIISIAIMGFVYLGLRFLVILASAALVRLPL